MNKIYTAFIFARGGSKGVVDKNIRVVAGKPLIAHTILCALGSKYVKRVVVSTDSEKIIEVARNFGAEILLRPNEFATDTSPELLSWKHAISAYDSKLSSLFISLPATSPLRTPDDVDRSIEKFLASNYDVQFGITPSHRNPYLNMVKINKNETLEIVIPGSSAVRRQDVPKVYDVTTSVYVAHTNYVLSCESIMQGAVGYIEIPSERSLDIDTEFDLYLADLILSSPFKEKQI